MQEEIKITKMFLGAIEVKIIFFMVYIAPKQEETYKKLRI